MAVAESSRKRRHIACISKIFIDKSLKTPAMKKVNILCFLSKIQEKILRCLSINEKVFKTMGILEENHTIIGSSLLCLKHLLKCPMQTRLALLRRLSSFCGVIVYSFLSPCSKSDCDSPQPLFKSRYRSIHPSILMTGDRLILQNFC